jgi:O-antigen ligase
MGFLLGLLTMVSWGLLQTAQNRREQIGWLAVTGLGLGLTLPTASRAALAIPVLAAALAAILVAIKSKRPTTRPKRSWIRALVVLILLALISTGSVLTWYRVGPAASENKISDIWRIETALCWAKAPIQQGQILFGLGPNENVRKLCRGNRLKSLEAAVDSSALSDDQRNAGKEKAAKGLPHAHNVFAQIFAETGLAGLSAALLACGWIGSRILRTLNRLNQQRQPADRLITGLLLPLCLYLLISSLITSFHIYLLLNQLAIGYLLGALNATDADRATAA